ncbi:MAG: glycosyltransferase family 2 protein [Patescibacteria group bacterium]
MNYSIIIPIYNEEAVLPKLYERLRSVCDSLAGEGELIFVDDGSRDQSLSIIEKFRSQDPRVKILSFSRNFGHQMAITAGLDAASGEAVVIIDADLQDPPELIPELIKKWREGYKVVYAERSARRGDGIFKRASARLFYRLLKWLTKYPIPENVGDFRLLDKQVVTELRQLREQHRFMRGLTSWVGFRQGKVAFVRDPRYAGETKYPFRKMLRFAFDGITSFSIVPLRLAVSLGFFIVIICVGLALWALGARFIFHVTIQGWTSLMLAVVFMGGVQLMMLGVVGEYVGRIYEEVKGRPLYIIERKEGFE